VVITLNSISSDSFQLDKVGSIMIDIKVKGFGNSISISEGQVTELIDMLTKARSEFYHDKVVKESVNKLLGRR
jgi:hypothetical protein